MERQDTIEADVEVKFESLQLRRLDLTLGADHEHPELESGKDYLIKYNGDYYIGQFHRVWYGWSFEGVYDAGLQYDQPGTNRSDWEGIWEIIKYPDDISN